MLSVAQKHRSGRARTPSYPPSQLRDIVAMAPRWAQQGRKKAISFAPEKERSGSVPQRVRGKSAAEKTEGEEKKEDAGAEAADETSEKFRAALWGLASIYASEKGLLLVQAKYDTFVSWVCKNAYEHEDFSVRGTCLCLLRLIYEAEEGRQTCLSMGWVCGRSGACPIPASFPEFFKVDAFGGGGGGGGGTWEGSPVMQTGGSGRGAPRRKRAGTRAGRRTGRRRRRRPARR